MCSIKTVYQKKVHKYTFLGLKLCFMLTINGLWGCEVGVLCRGSTPEVHSAGKRIRDAALYTFVYHYTFAAKSKTLII